MVSSWRRAGRLPLATMLLTGALLSVALGAGGLAGRAYADEPLVLGPPDLATTGRVSVVATVPPMLTGRPLPGSAFSAMQAGRGVPVTADRVVDRGAELVLVTDPTLPPDVVAAEQSAVADLLRSLPPELPTIVLPGGTLRTARTAFADIAALSFGTGDAPTGDATAGAGGAGLLDGAPPLPAGRRLIVLLTSCDALNRLTDPPVDGDDQVSVLAVGAGCEDRAAELAAPGGGLVRTGLDAQELLPAVDDLGRLLLGQYRLLADASPAEGPLQITVSAGGTTASGTVPLSAEAGASAEPNASADSGASAESGRSLGPVIAAIALLALLVLGIVGLAVLDRRRDRRLEA